MTSKEFNILTKRVFADKLFEFGFKNQKEIFYLHKPPNVLALIKYYQREYFQGFYIALTHDFLIGKDSFKLSPFLEDYPFSISIDELENQYQKYDSVKQFDCDTNFLTRVVLSTRTDTSTILSIYDKIRYDENLASNVIGSIADNTVKFGLKLMDEYSPEVSYQSITRHKKVKDFTLDKFKGEIEKFCLDNNLSLRKQKKSWFLFLK